MGFEKFPQPPQEDQETTTEEIEEKDKEKSLSGPYAGHREFQNEFVREGAKNEKVMEQDGGIEIHPSLKGVTFTFYHMVNQYGERVKGVKATGDLMKAPWAQELTGLFSGDSDPKAWMREEAEKKAGPSEEAF
jgi:hypothetical protein